MTIKFITNEPVAFIPEERALVIAELHLGLEHELFKKGIIIPPQRIKFQETLNIISKMTKAKILIILGDIKHKVPGITIREETEIPKLLEFLEEKFRVILVKGNHDAGVEEIIPKRIKIYGSRGFRLGKYGFFHGHAWPSKNLMKCDLLFMSHIHPCVEFRDRLGYKIIEQVWVSGAINKELVKKRYKIKKTGGLKIIILPTFNKLLGGLAINTTIEEDLIGPILKNKFLDINSCKLYLLDGTYIDIVKKLRA
ncbi:MAG: metallophosphoesterase [Candidatus Aenigmatarchaeota archaeon]